LYINLVCNSIYDVVLPAVLCFTGLGAVCRKVARVI